MHFAIYLQEHAVVEWSTKYIDYDRLRHILKRLEAHVTAMRKNRGKGAHKPSGTQHSSGPSTHLTHMPTMIMPPGLADMNATHYWNEEESMLQPEDEGGKGPGPGPGASLAGVLSDGEGYGNNESNGINLAPLEKNSAHKENVKPNNSSNNSSEDAKNTAIDIAERGELSEEAAAIQDIPGETVVRRKTGSQNNNSSESDNITRTADKDKEKEKEKEKDGVKFTQDTKQGDGSKDKLTVQINLPKAGDRVIGHDIEREFLDLLREELEKVDAFFIEQVQFFHNELRLLTDQQNEVSQNASLHDEERQRMFLRAEETLHVAFKELYRGLDLLKNFRILNYTALHKLAKKHDKCSDPHFKISHTLHDLPLQIFISREANMIEKRLEKLYITSFCQGMKRGEAIDQLRGQYKNPPSLWTAWALGLCMGSSFCLLIIFLVITGSTPHFQQHPYFTSAFPVFRGIGLLLTVIWLWGLNVYLYRVTRINHVFILKGKNRAFLHYQDVWEGAALLTVLYFTFMVVYFLSFTYNTDRGPWMQGNGGWFVLVFFALFVGMVCCPFDILRRPARAFVLAAIARVLTAPLTKVEFIDFFVGDHLCSMVRVLYDVHYSLCWFITGDFLTLQGARCTDATNTGKWVLAFIPYYCRIAQCLRRYRDSGWKQWNPHLINALKFFSSIVVTLFSLLTSQYPNNSSIRAFYVVFAIIGTLYCAGWDIFMDWGLLDRSAPGWIRKRRVLKGRWIYYTAAIFNLIFRGLWVITISPNQFGLGFAMQFSGMGLAFAEILRRSVWDFFRMENEHLNNCGIFRAVNIVPLPNDHYEPEFMITKYKAKKKIMAVVNAMHLTHASKPAVAPQKEL